MESSTYQAQVVTSSCHHDYVEIPAEILSLLVDVSCASSTASRILKVRDAATNSAVDYFGPGVRVTGAQPASRTVHRVSRTLS